MEILLEKRKVCELEAFVYDMNSELLIPLVVFPPLVPLDRRGKDGKSCVLRALCETGQKNQNGEKAPFLMEILRAVFSLPHQVEPYKKAAHEHFDNAHSELETDCSQLYPACGDSIWSKEFSF
jgi:DM4/DM12 family